MQDMKLHAHRAAAGESDAEEEAPLSKATAHLISKVGQDKGAGVE